ncbi:MAG: hypothetical protein Kow0069_16990 [Promethearchaeota archaeon]
MKQYSAKEQKVAQGFYVAIVAFLCVVVLGAVWSVLDFLQPTGKLEDFLALSFGWQVAIVGIALFGAFVLLISFYLLYLSGNLSLLNALFKRRVELDEADSTKDNLAAKLMTGGFFVSLIVVTVGLVVGLLQVAFTGTGDSGGGLTSAIASLSGGQLVLFIGVMGLAFTGLALGAISLWNNGYYFFLKKFFAEVEDDDEEYDDED